MADIAAAPRHSWLDTAKVYAKPLMLAMLVLGFASGLPLYMVYTKMSYWLRDAGIERSTIGFFYWVTLAYTLKFLWAPVVDRLRIPGLTAALGQRRSWMVTAIAGTVIGLLFISRADPAVSLIPVLIGAVFLAYSGATLDISIDAWRIESASNEMQANMAAAYSLGYRGAYLFAAFGLAIAEWTNWHVSFTVMALAMVICAGLVLVMPEPHHAARRVQEARSFAARVATSVIDPFRQVLGRLGVWIVPVLVLVAIYRISDFTMGVMTSPLYSDMGFSKTFIGFVQGGPGLAGTIFGLFLGGVATYRFGLMRAMIIGAVITLFTTATYAWLAGAGDADDLWFLGFALVGDNVAGGFVTTVFIAYLSSLTDPANAATQYALFSSFYALFNKLSAGFSGLLADLLGYVDFFLLTAAFTIPATALLLFIYWKGPPAARGLSKYDDPEEAAPA